MPVNNLYRVSLEYTAFGVNMANVFHYKQTAVVDNPPNTDPQQLAFNFYNFVCPYYVPILANDTTMNQIIVKGITDPLEGYEYTINLPGNGAADPMPLGVAAVISWRTSRADRSGRGRTFVGGFDEGFADNAGTITATGLGQLDDLAAALTVDMADVDAVTGAFDLGVYSRTLEEFNVVTSYIIRGFTKSQRDRNRK